MRFFSNKTGIVLFAASMCFATTASASVIVSGTEVGTDVVFSYEGSIDLTGLSFVANNTASLTWIGGNPDKFYSMSNFARYTGAVSAATSLSAPLTTGGVLSGDSFGFENGWVYVKSGYVSGTAISGSLTFANGTFSGMGLTQGSYVTTIPNDTITLNIGNVPAVPLPAGLPLLLVGLGAFGLIARRKTA